MSLIFILHSCKSTYMLYYHCRCVDMIKQSVYAELASDLEINKAIQYLRQQDIKSASEVLQAFEKKDSKVASAAATNLAFLNFLVRNKEHFIL